MPLPTNQHIPLLPASRPGDAIHSKPKHAILVRMSAQTLDALDAFPNVQVDLGDNPALYIGDICYPMKSSRESAIHELYLRASSATKKAAPLKLYANVVGQLDVARELQDDLRDKIRQSTQDAANQRNSRTTVLLDTPPDLPTASTSRKRKEPPASSTMFRKPLRPADKPKPLPSSSTPAPAPSTKPAPRDKESLAPLRRRMIQCLAVSERTEDQVIRLVAGADPTSSARRDVQDVLEQIAEPVAKSSSDKSPKTYCLKTASWTEARPYEWNGLSEAVRTKIARTARQALRALKLPDSDPAWGHVQYRSTGSNYGNPSDQGKSNTADKKPEVPPKRGVSSHDTKEKRSKVKADPKGDIMMKDESKPTQSRSDPPPRPNPPERRPVEPPRATASDSRRADVRKPTDRTGTPPTRRPPATEVKSSKPSARHEDPSPAKLQRQTERAPAPSVSAPKIADDKALASQRIKKIRREANGGGTSDSDRERSYAQTDRSKLKDKDKVVKREPVDSPREEMRASMSKRKAAAAYDDDDFRDSKAREKRRKTEPVQPPSQRERERERERERDRDRDRDISPKKVVNDPRPVAKAAPRPSAPAAPSKIKGGHDSMSPPVKRSPSNTSQHARYSPDSSMSSNLNHSHKSSSAKPRRRSPIYTSSEEDDAPQKTHSSPAKVKPAPPAPSSSNTSRDREPPSRNHQADSASLRAKYGSLYFEYLDCYYKVDRQKTRLTTMLKNIDLGLESEDDSDILDDEELAQLKAKHDRLRAELVAISKSYGQIIKSGDGELLPAPDMITA